MIRRPQRSTLSSSSAASDVYKRQYEHGIQNRLWTRNTEYEYGLRIGRRFLNTWGFSCCYGAPPPTPQWRMGVSHEIHIFFPQTPPCISHLLNMNLLENGQVRFVGRLLIIGYGASYWNRAQARQMFEDCPTCQTLLFFARVARMKIWLSLIHISEPTRPY